jgi:hypothetical protein
VREGPTWRIELAGGLILDHLVERFTEDRLRVVRDGDTTYLESNELTGVTDVPEIMYRAEALLDVANVLARFTAGPGVPGATIAGDVIEITPSGEVVRHSKSRVVISSVMLIVPDPPRVGPSDEERWLEAVEASQDAREVLTIWAGRRDGTAIGKVIEVIGQPLIVGQGWVSDSILRRLKHSIQDPTSFGDLGRHARLPTAPLAGPCHLARQRRWSTA